MPLQDLIQQLTELRSEMLSAGVSELVESAKIRPEHFGSAMNLLHYLVLRRHDIRQLQGQLAFLGLSSLGRTESHVLSGLDAVISALDRIGGFHQVSSAPPKGTPAFGQGADLLERNTQALFGSALKGRDVRIMVTVPTEAATDYGLVRDLLASGMDCMRINCAHDGPSTWSGMIRNLRNAQQETGKACKVAMDLAGPKLRTGPIEPGPAVLKYRPERDALGRVISPARILLTPQEMPRPVFGAAAIIPVPATWLARLKAGDSVSFKDARGASRIWKIRDADAQNRWATADRTAYIVPGLVLEARPRHSTRGKRRAFSAKVGAIAPKKQTLRLFVGDRLVLTRSLAPGQPAKYDRQKQLIGAARIGLTLPEFFDSVAPGDPIFFDDGKIGGVIREVDPQKATVEITRAGPNGSKLGAEKGVNVPESALPVPALTKDDLDVFPFIVQHADIVNYSFVRKESDIRELQAQLAKLGGENLGMILKIETREGFEQLPRLLLTAMRSRAVGVMIARGDLAIECGYQRLAEVQEEILWMCEAAHIPVIWATQVLESMAKTGLPSRAEITDAAMGERAECVMLNKGPYITTAVRILDDILRRMQSHQQKKRSMLRKLNLASSLGTVQ